jgi:murein DD-endopeptidase MepM/ murein hydrolase activator NlpD
LKFQFQFQKNAKQVLYILFGIFCCLSTPTIAQSEISNAETDQYPGGIFTHMIHSHLKPSAHYNNKKVLILPTKKPNQWQAVIGIHLNTKIGTQPLKVNIPNKAPQTITFKVIDKKYKKQYITLKNKRHVNPKPLDMKRINKEKKRIRQALNHWDETLYATSLKFELPIKDVPTSSPFGLRRFFNNQPRKPHSGIDLAAPSGTPIKAPANGIIRNTGHYFFNGKTVFIDHGQGLVSMYCHLSKISVTENQTIKQGDIIGKVGKTGRVTGAHLHWSISLNQAMIDPLLLLSPPSKKHQH